MRDAVSEVGTKPLDEVVGRNLARVRGERGLTQGAFSDAMHTYVGRGWQRAAVSRFENGHQPMSVSDLAAASRVLGCPVEELMRSHEPVSVGDRVIQPEEMAAAVSRPSVEEQGWQAFEAAAHLLNDVRNTSERYVTLMGRVRAHVAASPELRARILADAYDSSRQLREWLDEVDWEGAPGQKPMDMSGQRGLNNNATPAMRAARDALESNPGFECLSFAWKDVRKPLAADRGRREPS
jgi:transcriptional regulator with XRE-family HTH domain